jgi:hypothetical protein
LELMMDLAVIFAGLNIVVLVVLLLLYGRIAFKSRAAHSVGLVVFALFLLAQNLVTVLAYVTMSPLFGVEALPFLSGISGLEFVGLLVLAKITF